MRVWSKTDVGAVRKENQDAFAEQHYNQEEALLIVCDGMGGAKGGAVASKMAIETICEVLGQNIKPHRTTTQLADLLLEAAEKANKKVFDTALGDESLNGMGTTMVCLLQSGDNMVVGNIGDSRAYLIDEDGMQQITADHSLVAEMLRRKEITPQQAQHHPNKNVITRALGVDQRVTCDIFPLKKKKGQYILLCSDGLTNEVSEPEIYYEVYHSQKPEQACETLIEIAKTRGGHDNITVMLASF
ncbi:Stp1/IreP family PP2C-type Ser/Thr phosphatase [Acidaminobacterium chupaoyuni]